MEHSFESLLQMGLVKNDPVVFHPNWDAFESEVIIPEQKTNRTVRAN